MPISQTLRNALTNQSNRKRIDDGGNTSDRPDHRAEWYLRQLDDLELVHDVYGGTKTMREAGKKRLPQHEVEQEEDFQERLKTSVLFNAYAKTVHGLTGMVFRRDPILVDVPTVIEEHAENIDLQGKPLSMFAREAFRDAVRDGHGYIHVEFPTVDRTVVRTRRDEREFGGRPFWRWIPKSDLINARWEFVAGEPHLTLAVYIEHEQVDQGEFGQDTVRRYRVVRPGSFEVWEQGEKNRFQIVEEGPVSLPFIPIFPVYTGQVGFFDSCPPLVDLAHENVAHWQIRSDFRHALTLSCFPILVATGFPPEDTFKIGPNFSLQSGRPDASAQWIEPGGTSLDKVRQELQDIEARMAALGLQMLVRDTRAAETAESKRIDTSERDATLASMAGSMEAALNAALDAHAQFLGQPVEGGIEVNRDFRDDTMTPEMIAALSMEVERGHISLDTLWDRLTVGEILPTEFDPDLERDRLESQGIESLEAFIRARQTNTETTNEQEEQDG